MGLGAREGLYDVCVVIRAVVLFLVCTVERNIYDQRSLEYHIYESHGEIKVIRRTLHQVRTGGFLSPDKELIVSVITVCVLLFYDNILPINTQVEAVTDEI